MAESGRQKTLVAWTERFRERLRRALEKRGMLRQDLAKAIQFSPSAVTQNFSRPSEEFIRRVCVALPEVAGEWKRYRRLVDGPLAEPEKPQELTPTQREALVKLVQEMRFSLERIERLLK